MKKALITGSQGFVGHYLRQELESNGYEVTGLDLQAGEGVVAADLLNAEQVREIVAQVNPDAVFHLAGQASVAKSWSIPQKTVEINVIAAINLMEAVRAVNPACRMVMVGSSDQYGNLGCSGQQSDGRLGNQSSDALCGIQNGAGRNGSGLCTGLWHEYLHDTFIQPWRCRAEKGILDS